ncbi:MAG TPA: Xaa-Pro peptidase family protein [Pontiella sp.]
MRYLSGFTAPDPFLYLKTAAADYLVVSIMEKERAVRQSNPGTQVFTPAELGLKGKQSGRWKDQIIKLMEIARIRRIQVSSGFPAGLYLDLQKKGVNISVTRKAVCPERAVKSRDEIVKIRKSQQAAVAAMKGAAALIQASSIDGKRRLSYKRQPLTSETVRRHIDKILIEHDCIGTDTIVAGGNQATDPHERGEGQLYAGEAIIIDIFPQSRKTGYWGDITRTFCRGKAPAELKKLYLAVKAAQAEALKAVRAGVCGDEIHALCCRVFEERNFPTTEQNGVHTGFIHGTGHGVGLDIHEQPRIGRSGAQLEAGQVVTIEPGLYYPGKGGVRIEDTVVVTETGFRYLASCPKKFELL